MGANQLQQTQQFLQPAASAAGAAGILLSNSTDVESIAVLVATAA
jgi:hypothetical protein